MAELVSRFCFLGDQMANYLLAYHGGGMPETEEEGAKIMAAWGVWMAKVGPALIDAGNPVGQAVTIASDGSSSSSGGANPVTGYSVLSADNLDAALELVAGCPILASGGSVEICETFDVT
jgi:hypothetical protein